MEAIMYGRDTYIDDNEFLKFVDELPNRLHLESYRKLLKSYVKFKQDNPNEKYNITEEKIIDVLKNK